MLRLLAGPGHQVLAVLAHRCQLSFPFNLRLVGATIRVVDCGVLFSVFPSPQQTFLAQKSVFGAGLLEAFSTEVELIGLCLSFENVGPTFLPLPFQARFAPDAVWQGRFIEAVDAEVLLLGQVFSLLEIRAPVFGFLFTADVAGQSARRGSFLSAGDAYVPL